MFDDLDPQWSKPRTRRPAEQNPSWTQIPPSVAGWFWWKYSWDSTPTIRVVGNRPGGGMAYMQGHDAVMVSADAGWWFGPLVPP